MTRPATGHPPLRLVQIGIGGWGESWLDRVEASDDVELVAIVDTDADLLAATRRRLGRTELAALGTTAEATREVTADAALVVVPVGAHLEVAGAALRAGWHTLVEKPIADSMDHAHELVRIAESSGRTLMVSQNYRFRRTAGVVREVMGRGWLGPVHFASVQVFKEMHFVTPDLPHGFAEYRFIRDAAVHHLDQVRFCLGVEPVRVYGRQHNPEWSWFAHPPMVSALLELDGGGIVDFYGSWIARGRETSFDGDWHVECAGGQLRWSGNQVFVRPVAPWLTIQMDGFQERRDGWMEAIVDTSGAEDRTRVLEVFADCLRTGAEPPTSGRDNLRTAALTFALQDSAADGLARDVDTYLRPPSNT